MATKQKAGNREPVYDHGYVTELGLITTDRRDTPCMIDLVSTSDENSPHIGLDSSSRIGTGENTMQSTLGKSEWELGEQPGCAQADHSPDFGTASIDRSPKNKPIIDSPRNKSVKVSPRNKSVKVSPRNKSVKVSPGENDTEPWYKGESCPKKQILA
jgi:hypothetical protein